MELLTDEIPSEIGRIVIVAHEARLLSLDYHDCDERMMALLAARFGESVALRSSPNPFGLSDRIRAYLAGDLAAIDAVPVETGGTPFQRQVWAALRRIPTGTTISYAELAREVGRPTATRAVGMINGRNPVAIVVPCHRVIGKDSSLTGYAGGLHRKRWLLRHEGVAVAEDGGIAAQRRLRRDGGSAGLQADLPLLGAAAQEAAQ
jgi:methylated-DNA-[protein]-cysteine S-methyltransferase